MDNFITILKKGSRGPESKEFAQDHEANKLCGQIFKAVCLLGNNIVFLQYLTISPKYFPHHIKRDFLPWLRSYGIYYGWSSQEQMFNLLNFIQLSFYWPYNFISISISTVGNGYFVNFPIAEMHLKCWWWKWIAWDHLIQNSQSKILMSKSYFFYYTWIIIRFA